MIPALGQFIAPAANTAKLELRPSTSPQMIPRGLKQPPGEANPRPPRRFLGCGLGYGPGQKTQGPGLHVASLSNRPRDAFPASNHGPTCPPRVFVAFANYTLVYQITPRDYGTTGSDSDGGSTSNITGTRHQTPVHSAQSQWLLVPGVAHSGRNSMPSIQNASSMYAIKAQSRPVPSFGADRASSYTGIPLTRGSTQFQSSPLQVEQPVVFHSPAQLLDGDVMNCLSRCCSTERGLSACIPRSCRCPALRVQHASNRVKSAILHPRRIG
ncbi:hypothetical protein IQ07DRAFT_661936 [Pyrenochaeta sp. DS3sAY3a]|nr:hypothetical protein IQ07DRAFT_661936 [Pyrenochaeta sp. DS3sAY3a]